MNYYRVDDKTVNRADIKICIRDLFIKKAEE